MVVILFFLAVVSCELPSKIFDLPSLTIEIDQPYLVKNQNTTLTCLLSAGWSGAQLSNVTWLLDGDPVKFKDSKHYTGNDVQLTIHGGKQAFEGDYQCLANVHNVTLSNKQVVTTKLVSSPVKIRRARITKFDRISEHMVSVRQGDVTRLPCAGMPDVIPGPGEICFEKDGVDGCFGDRAPGSSNYLSTTSGMQIAMVQRADSGSYFCVVRNEYTKQTQRSPKPVILLVHDADVDQNATSLPMPEIVYPSPQKKNGIDKPIVLDVVLGQEALLECVFTNANIVWDKYNDTMPLISMNNADAPVTQIWGNLRFRRVMMRDSGLYSCHGLPLTSTDHDLNGNHTKVYYQLNVHGPTDVNLTLNENPIDKSWSLSCLATNLQYEIPMAFVNGTALVDAIDQMGIPSSTNFFTNPINATIQVNNTFSGSVQCISRPAMDEAEIYGNGLDRGKSHNVFVISTYNSRNNLIIQGPTNTTGIIGSDITLQCYVSRVKKKYWRKGNHSVKIAGGRMSTSGSHSLKIRALQKEDEGWYTCEVQGDRGIIDKASAYLTVKPPPVEEPVSEPFNVVKDDVLNFSNVRGFVTGTDVRLQWSVLGNVTAVAKIIKFKIEFHRKGTDGDNWIEADQVDSHVRATTIRGLLPNYSYSLRVILIKEDGSKLVSQPTEYMLVEPPVDIAPLPPKIDSISSPSANSILVQWSHLAPLPNGKARQFNVHYKSDTEDTTNVIKVEGNLTQVLLGELLPDTSYSVKIEAENQAGASSCPPLSVRTAAELSFLAAFVSELEMPSRQTIVLAVTGSSILVLMILICCLIYCNVRKPRCKKANGKFLDTSYRIFNEQKVHKSRVPDDNLYVFEDIDEHSPLKQKSEPLNDNETSFGRAGYGDIMPNLYGNLDDVMEIDDPAPPSDPTYVSSSKMGGMYTATPTARCYSPDSGTSHEMLVTYNNSSVRGSVFQSSPMMTSSPQRLSAMKCPDSLLYSPAGTASSLADTSSSDPTRMQCDSPTHANTDSSDQGIRVSSRNSQSSSDGSRQPSMTTFKSTSPNTTSFLSTFDRRTKQIPI